MQVTDVSFSGAEGLQTDGRRIDATGEGRALLGPLGSFRRKCGFSPPLGAAGLACVADVRNPSESSERPRVLRGAEAFATTV